MLFKDKRTVVTNTPLKILKMIERCTQTIICPNSNFITRSFIVGTCENFKIETYKNQRDINAVVKDQTSLMFLDGCFEKLGCSIVLSCPDVLELKKVRHVLIKCIKYARILFLEREYLSFVKPDIKFDQTKEDVELELDLPT